MNTYGLLLLPSHNRVCASAPAALARAELLVLGETVPGGRVPDVAETTTVRRERRALGRRFHATVGATKELYKQGRTIDITMVNADTVASGDFFRPASST
jgi:hypothetical protein